LKKNTSTIWFEDDVRLYQVGGERVVGGDLLPFLHVHHWKDLRPLHLYQRQQDLRPLHLYHRQQDRRPLHLHHTWRVDLHLLHLSQRNHRFTEHSDELRARSTWTTTAREYWMELCVIWGGEKLNENSIKVKQNRATHPEANVHTSSHVSFATHKARLESYSRGMNERYGDDSQRLELDPDIWVATSGAPKKGHVFGFGHSLGTVTVISSCSSSVSHQTSPFTTPTVPGDSSSVAPTMTPAQFREIINETVSQNISNIVSQTISQTLAQLGFLGDRAPPAQQPPVRILFD
ncbi:hypothetical protein Taro_053358, partial [Colocasia esculenta]|nr:hypothetical protein [Colocasia esculenta]